MSGTSTFREPIKVIGDILQTELGLLVGQVMIQKQKWTIPNTPGLYISLEYLGPGRTINAKSDFDPVSNTEIQTVNTLSVIQIDILSFDNSARTRKEEVAMALASVYSQQAQEQYQCQIARMPGPFMNVTSVEPSSQLKRYTTTITVTALFSKQKVVEYFDTFQKPEVSFND